MTWTGEVDGVSILQRKSGPLHEVAYLVRIIVLWPYVLFRVSLAADARPEDDNG